jgi:hypothetical protein
MCLGLLPSFSGPPSPIFLLSTILGATVTYQRDHLSTVRPLENGLDICAIGIGKAESEHVQVVFRMF